MWIGDLWNSLTSPQAVANFIQTVVGTSAALIFAYWIFQKQAVHDRELISTQMESESAARLAATADELAAAITAVAHSIKSLRFDNWTDELAKRQELNPPLIGKLEELADRSEATLGRNLGLEATIGLYRVLWVDILERARLRGVTKEIDFEMGTIAERACVAIWSSLICIAKTLGSWNGVDPKELNKFPAVVSHAGKLERNSRRIVARLNVELTASADEKAALSNHETADIRFLASRPGLDFNQATVLRGLIGG